MGTRAPVGTGSTDGGKGDASRRCPNSPFSDVDAIEVTAALAQTEEPQGDARASVKNDHAALAATGELHVGASGDPDGSPCKKHRLEAVGLDGTVTTSTMNDHAARAPKGRSHDGASGGRFTL